MKKVVKIQYIEIKTKKRNAALLIVNNDNKGINFNLNNNASNNNSNKENNSITNKNKVVLAVWPIIAIKIIII